MASSSQTGRPLTEEGGREVDRARESERASVFPTRGDRMNPKDEGSCEHSPEPETVDDILDDVGLADIAIAEIGDPNEGVQCSLRAVGWWC